MSGADTPQRTGVLFALPEESAPFLCRVRPDEKCFSVAVSGVGAQKAAKSATQMLRESGVKRLLICGFAGGLGGLPGDIVLAERVLHDGKVETALTANRELFSAATSLTLPRVTIHRGKLVTTDRVLLHPAEKRALAEQTGAIAVDMETAGAAKAAQEQDIPWLAIRVITDGLDDELPLDFNALADADGNPDRNRILRATLAQPWKIPALIRLGKRSSLAAENLAAFLEAFLQKLPEEK